MIDDDWRLQLFIQRVQAIEAGCGLYDDDSQTYVQRHRRACLRRQEARMRCVFWPAMALYAGSIIAWLPGIFPARIMALIVIMTTVAFIAVTIRLQIIGGQLFECSW